MQNIRPKPPQNLNPFSRELLESLAGHAEAAEIVLGGGVALSHYLEYRETVDLDAWWRESPRPEVLAFVEGAMKSLAVRHGLDYRRRTWGETESLELMRGGQKEFSFQISKRGLYLDEPVPTEWQPLWIETLRDNVASKMTALVLRGAPRDFLDIHQLCMMGVLTMEDCWSLWSEKNPGILISDAKRRIITRLLEIEASRLLDSIQPAQARDKAALVRGWYHHTFASPES